MAFKTAHKLKTWEDFYEAIVSGEKNFEVRRNDRGFQKGDILILEKWERGGAYRHHTREEMHFEVTYIITGEDFGVKDGFCVMGIKPMIQSIIPQHVVPNLQSGK